jgi:hypothetical protein
LDCNSAGRPPHGGLPIFTADPEWRDLILSYEYLHGENGRGIGASHQTGWTALGMNCIEKNCERASDASIEDFRPNFYAENNGPFASGIAGKRGQLLRFGKHLTGMLRI